MTSSFDTLAAAAAIENAGADSRLAKVIASQLRVGAGEPVTRAELDAALAALEARLMWPLVGPMVALAGVIIAAVKPIP